MKEELHQCPCSPATKCAMGEPCLGCETYSEWERNQEEKKYCKCKGQKDIICTYCLDKDVDKIIEENKET